MNLTWISRQGGKHFTSKVLIGLFPPSFGRFVDVFGGAGNVLLNRENIENDDKSEVFNDLDVDVYNMFRDMKVVKKEYIEKMDFTQSKEKWDKLRRAKFTNPVQRLYRNLYIYWWSYANKNQSYFDDKIRYDDGNKKREGLVKRFDAIQERLKNVVVLNKDYKTILKKYDGVDTFFFLDPPYEETDISGYKHGYIDMEEMVGLLRGLKGKWMLTYSDLPHIRKLFKGYTIKKLKTNYTIGATSNSHEGNEIIVVNY